MGLYKRENKKYLDYIRSQPCIICDNLSEPQHIRRLAYIPKRYAGGVGFKPHDCLSLPMCRAHHEECERGYKDFEDKYHIDIRKQIITFLIEYINERQHF